MRKLLIFSLSLTFCLTAISYNSFGQRLNSKSKVELELAIQHFQKSEFEQAIHYLEKLSNNSANITVYTYLYKSYINIEDFKKAEKMVKKQIKRFPKEINYIIDLGFIYDTQGNRNAAEQQYEKAIQEVVVAQRAIIDAANKFIGLNELEFAEKIYLKGKKKIKTYPFSFELAGIYYQLQAYDKMIEEYLNLIGENDGYLQSVQNSMQAALDSEKEEEIKDILRASLLKRIQKSPGINVFPEMLIWLYVQEKDFYGAFVQARALDKRNKESGTRMIALARLSMSNRDYESAIKCYQYVVDKGRDNARYMVAKKGLVNVYNEKIVNTPHTNEDLQQLKALYKSTLKDLGNSPQTVDLTIGLANLQAFYLNEIDSAITLLQKTLKLPGISEKSLAEAKLKLGDIYVISDEIWEASLLYSQVNKAFKYDELGEIAKFKNAKVFYYSGDFNWAKGQLNVLKGSTSKLIANDAMQLSLLITDNTTIDTLKTPLIKFAKAELLLAQNKTEAAKKLLDSIAYLFPSHALADEIIFKKYEISMKEMNYNEAANYLEKLSQLNSNDILADDALFLLGELYEYHLNDTDKAMELYNKLLKEHADSIYSTEARKRFRTLRGDILN